ncbi:Regulation of nuclear pre-mRNA domain-containing protein 1B, partial [Stegodyphus mimosarum]
QDLENCPSTDAVVREKIASLPPEVSDITLLEKIQSREAAEKLTKQVDEACAILADYNNRLSEELEDRKQVSK